MRASIRSSSGLTVLSALLLVLSASALVSAQSHLDQAEAAYGEIEFERALAEAEAGLADGTNGPEQLARIYELIGMSAAALDQGDKARDAYIRMLALRPDAQVNTSIAPRLRAPFMEARGFWSSRSGRLTAEVRLVRRRGSLRVELSDPMNMATHIVLRSRVVGAMTDYQEQRLEATESALLPIGALPAPQIEYYLEILDEHGNRLIAVGTDEEPRVLGEAPAIAPLAARAGPEASEDGSGGVPAWVWIGLGVLVVGAAATGIYYGVQVRPIDLQSGTSGQ